MGLDAVVTLGTALSTMQSQITSTLSSLREFAAVGELQTAFENASSCQTLSG